MRIPPDLIKGDGLLAVKRYMNKTAHALPEKKTDHRA